MLTRVTDVPRAARRGNVPSLHTVPGLGSDLHCTRLAGPQRATAQPALAFDGHAGRIFGMHSSRAPAYLLTWNPGRFSRASFWEKLAAVERGEAAYLRWSCGNTTTVPAGARAFLLRQGEAPRGIVASGWTTHPSHQAPHWDDAQRAAGDLAWYVGLGLDALLHAEREPPLDVHGIADGPLARVYWAIPESGTRLDVEAAAALEAKWTEHLAAARPASLAWVLDYPELAAVEGIVRERLVRHRSRERALRAAKLAAARAATLGRRLRCEVPGAASTSSCAMARSGQGTRRCSTGDRSPSWMR